MRRNRKRTITDPTGAEWTIYPSRMELPTWHPEEIEEMPPAVGGAALLFGLFDVLRYLLFDLLIPLVRFVAALPLAYARGLHSNEWTIEAATYFPVRERFVWTTNHEHLEDVVECIAAGLERGVVPRPQGAVFRGSH